MDIIGEQSSAKRIQLGYVLTKTMQLAHHQHTNTYFWLPTQNSRDKMIGKNMKRQEDLKGLLNRSEPIISRKLKDKT